MVIDENPELLQFAAHFAFKPILVSSLFLFITRSESSFGKHLVIFSTTAK